MLNKQDVEDLSDEEDETPNLSSELQADRVKPLRKTKIPKVENADNAASERKKKPSVDQSVQANTDSWQTPDWTRFDLGRALAVLRHGAQLSIRKTLQRLHVR